MNFFCGFVLILVVFQASAEPNHSFQSNCFKKINSINVGYGPSLPVKHIHTAVMENPTVNFPDFIPPAGISESCHCMRTLVRPQIRNEIISVPSVDRIIRTVCTPAVETIDCGGGSRLVTFTKGNNILSGVSGGQSMSDAMQCKNLDNSARSTDVFFNEASLGNFATDQNTNCMNAINVGLIARPSVITIQTSNGGNSQGHSNIVSETTGFSSSAKSINSNLHLIVK